MLLHVVIIMFWGCYVEQKHLHNVLRMLWEGYQIETWKEFDGNVMRTLCVSWELYFTLSVVFDRLNLQPIVFVLGGQSILLTIPHCSTFQV